MWVKICGTTNLEDAQLAVEAGADAVGFVFAPSPRQVEPALVRKITERLPEDLAKYGVFVDANWHEIVSTVAASGLTGVQLHRSADPLLAVRLRQEFPGLSILGVLHYQNEFEQRLTELEESGALDAVLVDSRSVRAAGGTGTSFDWNRASSSFLRTHRRLVVAGGLSPENVKQAIETLRPWGVDVVSGVEKSPGKKDPARVAAFIQTAKQSKEGGQ